MAAITLCSFPLIPAIKDTPLDTARMPCDVIAAGRARRVATTAGARRARHAGDRRVRRRAIGEDIQVESTAAWTLRRDPQGE